VFGPFVKFIHPKYAFIFLTDARGSLLKVERKTSLRNVSLFLSNKIGMQAGRKSINQPHKHKHTQHKTGVIFDCQHTTLENL